MRIVYQGPIDALEIPTDDNLYVAERGKPVELPDEIALALLDQADWKTAEAPLPASTPKTTTRPG